MTEVWDDLDWNENWGDEDLAWDENDEDEYREENAYYGLYGFQPSICTPQRCGSCWLGDGLCQLEIDFQMQEEKDFYERFSSEKQKCPGCGVELTQYWIPADELWVWPGEGWPDGLFYSPMIGLSIFGPIDCPKGEVHEAAIGRFYRFCHIWVGKGGDRSEALIMLNKPKNEAIDETLPL